VLQGRSRLAVVGVGALPVVTLPEKADRRNLNNEKCKDKLAV
jgi:hypothetical protein